ncbi:MAG TPA: hypothetical protein VGN52_22215 [Burkholderiales bacterium]|jgi:hypothetical protein
MPRTRLFALLALCAALLPRAAPAQDALDGPPYEVLRYRVSYDDDPRSWSYDVRLFSDRKAYYVGRGPVKTPGRRVVVLNEPQYDSLLRAVEYANLRRMPAPKPGARDDIKWSITYSGEDFTRTVSGANPGPDWPKRLFQLIWSLESVLQTKDLACPINQTIERTEHDACGERNALFEQYYPRR